MKESRYFRILYYLLEHGVVSASRVAEELEVSLRTIYRDVDMLSSAGIPIYMERGRYGGIHLDESFVLKQGMLEEEEKEALLFAIQSMHAINGDNTQFLSKLSALFQKEPVDWMEVDDNRWGQKRLGQNRFALCKQAILEKRVLSFRYINAQGSMQDCFVQPMKLIYKEKAWYLQAYVEKKQAFRTYKLYRMDELHLMHTTYERKEVPPLEQYDNAYPLVTLRFQPITFVRLLDEFALEKIQKQRDGTYVVEAQLPMDGWLCGYLLSFGEQVDILSPRELKEALHKQALRIAAHHAK